MEIVMDDLYILSYVTEDCVEQEKEFTAETLEEAIMLATSTVKGGEGLLSAISLSDGASNWIYDYSDCEWLLDNYDF
jgi:hypothetical protein